MAKIEDYFKLELFTLGFTLRCYLQFEFLSNSLNKHIFLLDLLINTKLYNCVDHCECFNPINQLMVNVQQVECGLGLSIRLGILNWLELVIEIESAYLFK